MLLLCSLVFGLVLSIVIQSEAQESRELSGPYAVSGTKVCTGHWKGDSPTDPLYIQVATATYSGTCNYSGLTESCVFIFDETVTYPKDPSLVVTDFYEVTQEMSYSLSRNGSYSSHTVSTPTGVMNGVYNFEIITTLRSNGHVSKNNETIIIHGSQAVITHWVESPFEGYTQLYQDCHWSATLTGI